jgi:predicted RNA-binding protein YlqC (UPF0109 family)
MKNFLKSLICEIVNAPQDVAVNEIVGQNTTIFEVSCRKEDIGKIIGKAGKTIEAIRLIMIAIAAKTQSRINIEILE